MLNAARNPLVMVISGPSGVGKDAVIDGIKEAGVKFHHVITATTRPMRAGETDGVDYIFLSEKEFTVRLRGGEFLEHARVYKNHYGVLKSQVSGAIERAEDVIIKVDVQGAATLKRKMPSAILVFLLPPSEDELSDRIRGRNTDTESDVDHRLGKLEEELKYLPLFDYAVVNHRDDLAGTVNTILCIIKAEKCRHGRKPVALD